MGGGTGRYALLFAKEVKDVLMTDISSNMLGYAKENTIKNDLENIRFIKVDWSQDDETDRRGETFDLL